MKGVRVRKSRCTQTLENFIKRLSAEQRVISVLLQQIRRVYKGCEGNTFFVPNSIDDDSVDIPPPSHKYIKVLIMRLKNSEVEASDGLITEWLKTGCNGWAYATIIYKIW